MSTRNSGQSLPALLFLLVALGVIAIDGLPLIYGFTYLNGKQIGFAPVVGGVMAAAIVMFVNYLIGARLWRYTSVPGFMLVLGFFWGASSIALHSQLSGLIPALPDDIRHDATFDGGVMEEFAKGLFLFGLAAAGQRCFTSVIAGIVIGWFVGLGFATLENTSYFTGFIRTGEYTGLGVRMVVGLLASHTLFTALTGAMIALLIRHLGRRALIWAWPVALAPAVLLHASNNGLFGDFVAVLAMPPVALAILVAIHTKLLQRHVMQRKARPDQVGRSSAPTDIFRLQRRQTRNESCKHQP